MLTIPFNSEAVHDLYSYAQKLLRQSVASDSVDTRYATLSTFLASTKTRY